MAEARDGRGVSALRWTGRWSWAAVLTPLVACLGVSLRPAATPAAYRELGVCWLPPRVWSLQTGADRAGTHVAMMAGDGRIHLLALKGRQIETSSMPVPWQPERLHRLRLAFTDFNQDGLADLALMEMPSRQGVTPPWESDRWRVGLFAQEREQFKLTRLKHGRPYHSEPVGDRVLYAGSVGYAAERLFDGASDRVLTRLVNVETRRAAHVLEGEPFRISDLDGDGDQDMLTLSAQDERRPWATYTAYLYRDGEFKPSWTGSYQQNDLSRMWLRSTQLADLEGDGTMELIVSEPHLGKVTVLGIAPVDS